MSVQCFTWWGMTGVKSLLDAQQNLRAEQRCAGDDLIGPRDIKRGVHLLTNAEMALLIEDAEAEEEPTARGRRKRRDSATLRGDKLTEEQITQVSLLTSSTGHAQSLLQDLLSCRCCPTSVGGTHHASLRMMEGKELAQPLPGMQIHERIAQELDPDGAGLSYSDFESITSRMPDFFVNFKMSV